GKVKETREVQFATLTGTGTPRIVKEQVTFPAVPGLFRLRGSIPLVASEDAEFDAPDDHHSATSALEVTPAMTVNGRFLHATQEDWYRFTAKKGEGFTIRCRPFPDSSAALPVLALFDATGSPLGKASAADADDRVAEFDWTAPADGVYRLRLRDLQHGTRGGPEFIYRLTLRPMRPDFALRVEPDFVTVVQGGKTEVDLFVRR